jgi:hypothetical protein
MWEYGVYGLQREERLCVGKTFVHTLCEEANRQVPPMLFRWHLFRVGMVLRSEVIVGLVV